MRLIPKTNINFIGKRKGGYIFSAILIAASLLSLFFRGLNYGIDFTGGTIIHISLKERIKTEDLRSILAGMGVREATVQESAAGYEFIIKIGPGDYLKSSSFSSDLLLALQSQFPKSQPEVLKEETVGPRIGKELQRNTLIAVVLGLIGILIYVSFRFDFRFGTGAILALLHDTTTSLGYISLLSIPVNIPIVAALLTIIGYSVNDSIVVSDRVRENIKKLRREDFLTVLNRSINEVLSRTLLTSFTTLLVTIILVFLGAADIKDFARVMTFGVIVGTYSSIYILCPFIYEWHKRLPQR